MSNLMGVTELVSATVVLANKPDYDSFAKHLSEELAAQLAKTNSYDLDNKKSVALLMTRVMAELDMIDEQTCRATDYLQCQIEHKNNRDEIVRLLEQSGRLGHEMYEVHGMFRELRDKLMESIRYGKRSEELDQLLVRTSQLIQLVNQMNVVPPAINFAGMDKALSPRCASCTEECRSAHRHVQVFLRRLIQSTARAHPKLKAPTKSAND